jgi:HEPN domain
VQKAESDFQLVAGIARRGEKFQDELCFHCQQAAEKYLKALLEELGQPIPKTHNLVTVLQLLVGFHKQLRSFRRGVDFLIVLPLEPDTQAIGPASAKPLPPSAGPNACDRSAARCSASSHHIDPSEHERSLGLLRRAQLRQQLLEILAAAQRVEVCFLPQSSQRRPKIEWSSPRLSASSAVISSSPSPPSAS